MEEEQQLSFFLEWYDPQSDQLKPYVLHYHGDNTVEMLERYSKRIFLKRIRIPTVKLDALVPGGSITVYSRQLSVIDAANEYTKQLIKKRANKALFVVRPRGYAHMGKVIQVIESSGLVLLNTVMAQLERSHANALNVHCLRSTASDSEDMDDLLRDVSVLIEVKQPTPNTLEDALNRLEAAHLRQHVLVGEIGLLDAFAFSSSASSKASSSNKSNGSAIFPSTAVFDNCSLCLLRPRMLRESHVGEILDAILKAGFEISAIKTLHFQMNDADEFFRVYKGIVRQYHEVLKNMCSGPCLALEVRGDDVVHRFRELCGPFDVQIAQALRPQSLRAKLGKTNLLNALHCTDCEQDGVLESQFIFHSLA
ncbi:hypothetical protein Gpo141_00000182 [Globisporangium polare]